MTCTQSNIEPAPVLDQAFCALDGLYRGGYEVLLFPSVRSAVLLLFPLPPLQDPVVPYAAPLDDVLPLPAVVLVSASPHRR